MGRPNKKNPLAPPIPTEPGPWAMSVTALGVGIGSAGVSWSSLFFVISALLVFLLRAPLEVLGKGRISRRLSVWALAYSGLAAIFAVPLLLWGRWFIVPLGLVAGLSLLGHVLLVRRRKERTWWGELVGIGGLSLGSWGANYASEGVLDGKGALLALLVFLYLGSSVFFVKMMVRRKGECPLRKRLGLGRDVLLYQALLWPLLAGLVVGGLMPLWALVAFIPLALKVFLAVFAGVRPSSIRALGRQEVAYSAAFAVLLVLAFRIA